MTADARGLHLTGSAAAVTGYDQAIDDLIRFRPEVVDAAAAAVAADPGCAMAAVFSAYLALMSTEPGAVATARAALDGLRADPAALLPRERAHLAAAARWVTGDMIGAGEALGEISVSYPGDLLALFTGHQIDFFTGNAVSLRDRIGRALGGWPSGHPQLGFVHGMYAFGLEECNLYQQSEGTGRRRPWSRTRTTCGASTRWCTPTRWRAGSRRRAVHAPPRGGLDDGQLPQRAQLLALRAVPAAGGDTAGALAVYDRMLHHEGSPDVALELLDATALLWRMHLDGTAVGDRWPPLAAAWGRLLAPGFYPFNDMHAVLAFIGNGELDRAGQVVAAQAELAAHGDPGSTGWAMMAQVGLPVCRALVHFGRGEYGSCSASCCRSGPSCTRSAAVTRSGTRWSALCSKRPSGPGGRIWPLPWSVSGCRSARATPTRGRSGPGCAGPRATSRARRPRQARAE